MTDPFCGRAGCRHLMSMHSTDMNFCQVPDCKCYEWIEAVIPVSEEDVEDYRTAMQAFLDENVRLRIEVVRLRNMLGLIASTAQVIVNTAAEAVKEKT